MTPNEAILLLDCVRGFRPEVHTGNLTADREKLVRHGLITNEMVPTQAGHVVVKAMLEKARDSVIAKNVQLVLLDRKLLKCVEAHRVELDALLKERTRISEEVT